MVRSEAELGPKLTETALREAPLKPASEMSERTRAAMQTLIQQKWPKQNGPAR